MTKTLYFADDQTERASRAALHQQVAAQVNAIRAAGDESMAAELSQTETTYKALRRHGAYLKIEHLENIDDKDARAGLTEVEVDEAVLDAAVSQRMMHMPEAARTSLGRFARLLDLTRQDLTHKSDLEVERYRASVTGAVETDIVESFQKRLSETSADPDLKSSNPLRRKKGYDRRERNADVLAPLASLALATVADIENKDAIDSGYHNAAQRKYTSLGLNDAMIDRALALLQKHAGVNRAYQQLRFEQTAAGAKLQDFWPDELDLHKDEDFSLSLGVARKLILDGLQPLGTDYVGRFANLLDPTSGRLDLAGGLHRASAGTSISVYDAPVSLYYTRFDGTLNAVRVIAHEGGHAIHRELMNVGGSPIYQRSGPHYVFEAFAELNELLVLEHIAESSSDQRMRIRALERLTSDLAYNLFGSAEETAFERNLYVTSAARGFLERDQIDAMYRSAIQPYEYWPMSKVGTSRAWMNKSLLFEDPLYLVNYLYATLLAANLYEKVLSDKEFAGRYSELLREGFASDPQKMLEEVGIKWDQDVLVENAVRLFQVKTEQLRAAYAEQKRSHIPQSRDRRPS